MKIRSLLVIMVLLVSANAGLAQDNTRPVITIDNAGNLDMLMRVGRGSAEHIAWSPNGEYILVGGTLGVWKYEAGALDTEMEPQLINPGGELTDFDISADGSVVAIAHSNSAGVSLHDFATGDLISDIELENYVQRLGYSSDGTYIVANNASYGVTVLEATAQSVYTTAEASLDGDVPVLLNPDGSKLVAATSGYDILIWDFVAGGDPLEMEGHSGSVEDMAISPDGTLLVTGSTDDTFIVWDLMSGEMLQTFEQPEEDYSSRDVYAVAFSPDGSTLLTGHTGRLRFWDVASRAMSTEVEVTGSVRHIAWSPDGTQFVVRTADPANAVQLFNADGTHLATTFYHNADIEAVTFSPDSAVMAFNDNDGYLYMWDTGLAGEITAAFKIEDGASFGLDNLSNITFSSDNRYLATLQSFSATLRDPINGELIREFEADGIAQDIEFSPDNSMLAFITSQGLYVFDVETGTLLAEFYDANDWVQDVTWSPDQTMLATAASDHAVRVYTISQ